MQLTVIIQFYYKNWCIHYLRGVEQAVLDMSNVGELFGSALPDFSLEWRNFLFFQRTLVLVPCPPDGSEMGFGLVRSGSR